MNALRSAFVDKFAVNDLTAVNALLESAEVEVTFWGRRVLAIQDYSGYVTLDEVAEKTLEIGKRILQKDLCDNIATRIAGVESCDKIREFYITSGEQLRHRNFFTQTFNYFREDRREWTRGFLGNFIPSSCKPTRFIDKMMMDPRDFLSFGDENRLAFLTLLTPAGWPLPQAPWPVDQNRRSALTMGQLRQLEPLVSQLS